MVAVAALLSTTAAATPALAHKGRDPVRWAGGWGSALVAPVPELFGQPNWSGGFENQSLRQVVRVSRGGSTLRIRLSNVYGDGPLVVTGASIGRAAEGAAVRPGTLRPLTFKGRQTIVIPAGQEGASDALRIRVSPLYRLTVTIYFAGRSGPVTFHPGAFATAYRAGGDHRFDSGPDAYGETSESSYLLSGVDVNGTTKGHQGTVVAFGDSITDGAITTVDADNRYPDELVERLVAAGRPIGVVNAGIGGNGVITGGPGIGVAAVERFRRDALGQPGVRTVIVLEGINDIGMGEAAGTPVTAEQLITGHKALIRAAHWRGVRIIGATITPSKGCPYPGYDTPNGQAVRDAVNHWIRTSGAYDAVFDFDKAIADPADPGRIRPEYDAGDALHPNDAGMRAMAEAVDLTKL